jgi:hypothetical protein
VIDPARGVEHHLGVAQLEVVDRQRGAARARRRPVQGRDVRRAAARRPHPHPHALEHQRVERELAPDQRAPADVDADRPRGHRRRAVGVAQLDIAQHQHAERAAVDAPDPRAAGERPRQRRFGPLPELLTPPRRVRRDDHRAHHHQRQRHRAQHRPLHPAQGAAH